MGRAVICGTAVHRRAVGCSWAPENPTHLDRRSGKARTHTMGRKGGVGVSGGTGGSQQLCRKFQQASALAAVPLHISASECLNLSARPGGVGTHSGAPCDHTALATSTFVSGFVCIGTCAFLSSCLSLALAQVLGAFAAWSAASQVPRNPLSQKRHVTSSFDSRRSEGHKIGDNEDNSFGPCYFPPGWSAAVQADAAAAEAVGAGPESGATCADLCRPPKRCRCPL